MNITLIRTFTKSTMLALLVLVAGLVNAADKPGWTQSIKAGLTNACVKTFQVSIKLRYEGAVGRAATADEVRMIASGKPTFRTSCTCSINQFSSRIAYEDIKNSFTEVESFFMSTYRPNGSCSINQQELQTRMNATVRSTTYKERSK